MPVLRATFGNRVRDAAHGAAELGLKAAGLNLHFLDEVLLEVLAHAADIDVGSVDTVDQIGVFTVASSIDLKPVRSVAASALQRFLAGAGSKLND